MLEGLAKIWTAPLANTVIVLGSILLLYPIIWRITFKQLNAAMKAIETAKDLPLMAANLTTLSDSLTQLHSDFDLIRDRVSNLAGLNDELEKATRLISDLQKQIEDQLPLPVIEEPAKQDTDDADNWEAIKAQWDKIKTKIESSIDGIYDGRVRRKYNKESRYNYEIIAEYLYRDAVISHEQKDALLSADRQFRSIRNRRTKVTDELVRNFDRNFQTILATP